MEEHLSSQIRIERPLYEHHQLRQDFHYEKPKKTFMKNKCRPNKTILKKTAINTIPVIRWLSHYKWKSNISSDLISGFTVAIMHIPQGMAYALLGNVPPVIGIYMAFFPVLAYFLLGSSRHNSMGTFAVVCLMTGKAVLEHSDPYYFQAKDQSNLTVYPLETGYSPVQVATTVTFTVAMFQLAMCALKLGAVSALLSETLVSGFTTGAAIHVFTSQIKDLLGLNIPKFKGYFVIWNTIKAIIYEIGNLNFAALAISVVTIIVSSINNEYIKPIVAKKSAIPIPIELIAVVLGTIISKYSHLPELYNITTVGKIPNGFPEPTVPQFPLIFPLLLDGFTIAIVSYTVTLSMALIFAQKLNYEIDANQELLAMGTGNVIGSFFSCMPFCASLSRSLIQQVVGGKTQIASLISCGIIVVVLLWIGPFFEYLPKSVLASVIVVALKGMVMQITAVWKFWKLSKMDAVVWMVTFLTVVFISIDIGLLIGIIMSLIVIFILGFKPYTCLLGSVPKTDLYLDVNKYKGTKQIDGIKIFHYCGGVNFATRNMFKNDLIHLVEINPLKEIVYRSKLAQLIREEEMQVESTRNKEIIVKIQGKVNTELRCLIMDFSSVSYIDPSGVTMLKNIIESFQKLDIPIYIAACPDHVFNMMKKCNLFNLPKSTVRVFSTIHDAVQYSSDLFKLSLNSNISCIRL